MKHFKWLWSVWPFEVLALVFKALQANCHYESRWRTTWSVSDEISLNGQKQSKMKYSKWFETIIVSLRDIYLSVWSLSSIWDDGGCKNIR